MQTALSSKRSWIARIAVLAMVASLMAIAAPAGAVIDTSGACPDEIPSAGFTDLAGVPAAAVDAIDCLAFYEISQGTSATTYSPFEDVERWQMALFLTRQAEAHGLTLPDGSDQGFTDLAGVPAAAVTAINQLAQLNISLGTSATTFDPFADVERWQMALFIVRLVDIAIDDNDPNDDNANNLPSGEDQGFTDLAGVPAAAVTAINQLAQLEISEGTTATTFDPFADVARWAMALFLTRTLEADGITPDNLPVGTFNISPNTASNVVGVANPDTDTSDDVQFTVTNPASGVHSIELYAASDINADGEFTGNTDVASTITVVNGSAVNGEYIEASPVSGSLVFTVDAAASFESIVAVVFADSDGDNVLDTDTDGNPTEPYGISGVINVTPPEAAAGAPAADADIIGLFKATNTIVANDGTQETYEYDANDRFYIGAVAVANEVTLDDFEAKLTVGDDLLAAGTVYNPNPALQSTFSLNNTNPAAPAGLAVTATGSTTAVATVTTASVETGAAVNIKIVADAALCTASAVQTASATTDQDANTAGFQVNITGLSANTSYEACATQTVDGEVSAFSAAVGFTTLPTPSSIALSSVTVNEVNNGVGSTDDVVLTFSKDANFVDDDGVTAGLQTVDVTVSPTGQPGVVFTSTAVVSGDGTTSVVIDLDADLFDAATDVQYTVTVAAGALLDDDGAPNAKLTGTFSY